HLTVTIFVEAGLQAIVGERYARLTSRPIEHIGKVSEIVRFASGEVADARMRPHQQGASPTELVLHHGRSTIAEDTKRIAALEPVGLEEPAAADRFAAEV